MSKRRRLTPGEKLQNRIERHDRLKVEKGVAQAPLFAEQVKEEVRAESLTPRELFWKDRFRWASGAEGCFTIIQGNNYLGSLTEQKVRRLARQYVPPEVHDALTAYRVRTYPTDPTYGIEFWEKVLAGEQVIYACHGEECGPTPEKPLMRRRVVIDGAWPPDGWAPPFTKQQLWELFPPDRWSNLSLDPAPFDATTFDLRQLVLAHRTSSPAQAAGRIETETNPTPTKE